MTLLDRLEAMTEMAQAKAAISEPMPKTACRGQRQPESAPDERQRDRQRIAIARPDTLTLVLAGPVVRS